MGSRRHKLHPKRQLMFTCSRPDTQAHGQERQSKSHSSVCQQDAQAWQIHWLAAGVILSRTEPHKSDYCHDRTMATDYQPTFMILVSYLWRVTPPPPLLRTLSISRLNTRRVVISRLAASLLRAGRAYRAVTICMERSLVGHCRAGATQQHRCSLTYGRR